jgi:hypothetical protein
MSPIAMAETANPLGTTGFCAMPSPASIVNVNRLSEKRFHLGNISRVSMCVYCDASKHAMSARSVPAKLLVGAEHIFAKIKAFKVVVNFGC